MPQLVAGHPVVWMIMFDDQKYPIYNLKPPAGMYGHVEPVIGIMSNHPLNDTTVYSDDVVMHYTDAGTKTVHAAFADLPTFQWSGVGEKTHCRLERYYCIGEHAYMMRLMLCSPSPCHLILCTSSAHGILSIP